MQCLIVFGWLQQNSRVALCGWLRVECGSVTRGVQDVFVYLFFLLFCCCDALNSFWTDLRNAVKPWCVKVLMYVSWLIKDLCAQRLLWLRKRFQKVCVATHEYLNGKKKFGHGALLKFLKNTVRVGLKVHTVKCLELLVRYYDGE